MNLKYILCACGGLLAGAGIVGAIAHRRIKKYDNMMLETEGHIKDISESVDYTLEACKNISDGEDRIRDKLSNDLVDATNAAERWKNSYYDLLKQNQEQIPEDPVTLAPEEDPLSEAEAYVITIADFMDDIRYNKKYCEYYRETDSLVDTKDDTEMDPETELGSMRELLCGWVGTELFVRNTRTNTDYQIDFMPGPFGDGGD